MRKIIFPLITLALCSRAFAQLSPLTVEKIMRDPKWIGTSPSEVRWTPEGDKLLFNWNPEKATSDSLYYIIAGKETKPDKAKQYNTPDQLNANAVQYNRDRSAFLFILNGDVYLKRSGNNAAIQLTQTEATETNPSFSLDEKKIRYFRNRIAYELDLSNGSTKQLYTIAENDKPEPANKNTEEQWLSNDAIANSEILQSRKQKREQSKKIDSLYAPKPLPHINAAGKNLMAVTVSPDGRWITYVLMESPKDNKHIVVPDYVTESGYTTDIPGRTKVGEKSTRYSLFVLDLQTDSSKEFATKNIPGIKDQPDYIKDYPNKKFFDGVRPVSYSGITWSPEGKNAIVNIFSDDNKDRWIAIIHPEAATLEVIDRQRDEAWVDGPGINDWSFWSGITNNHWIDENTYWYQSEASGYSHLYSYDLRNKSKKQLTSGAFEIKEAWLSNDKKSFYFISNEVHPGEKQLYKMPVTGGTRERLTDKTGAYDVTISPDEKYIAYRYSYINKPWELYLQENKKGATPQQITFKAQSEEFKRYPWRTPEIATFTARDGAKVYARIYPAARKDTLHPAVVFVHGAGYLQNAHKWWSDYFHEYMFNNLLADNGYTVIDMDYRGSAGYGRDWRTGIYRHMGGRDLTDNVDGVKYLVDNYHVDPKRVGLYGGSYGGFITLMAMFKEADVFKAGAALRSVVNWANYNHGYTSNILNEPFNDSLAYRRSSPIYFANGLKGHLLMCHGMVDTNVNFQDIVQLTQRLIELGKDNWELAAFPKEDHGFVEPSSWTDEYKRIFHLFQIQLK